MHFADKSDKLAESKVFTHFTPVAAGGFPAGTFDVPKGELVTCACACTHMHFRQHGV